jgi:CRP-like cAMP-binding protein
MNLSDEAIKSLKKIASFKTYSATAPLYYKGQTPIVAYLIIKGSILLIKNNKTYHKLTKGCLVGYQELFLDIPSMFTAEVLSNTEICHIDKSTLLEIKNSTNPKMGLLYSELTNIVLSNLTNTFS